jgi:hypothetical protein
MDIINLTPPPDRNKNNEGPKIKLPEDVTLTKSLQDKLAEYEKRFEKKQMERLAQEDLWDVIYKIAVLNKLLTDNEVDINKVSAELTEEYGSVNEKILENAIAVIEDYIKTGGKNLAGGTGLKKERDLVEGQGVSVEEAKQTALAKFPTDATTSIRGRALVEKLLLEGLTEEEKIELTTIKTAISRFPDNHLGQHLVIMQAQGMITPEDRERLKIIEEFPKATLVDIVSIIDLRKKEILPGLNKAEQEKLNKIIGKLK